MKYYHIHGIRRSGNHIVINWIAENFLEKFKKVIFFNDINPMLNEVKVKGSTLPCINHPFTLLSDNFDCVIASLENRLCDERENLNEYRFYDFFKEKKRTKYEIIVIRDFYNLLASQYQATMVNNWGYAKSRGGDLRNNFGGFEDMWAIYVDKAKKKEMIVYDDFIHKSGYRKELALKLGFADQDVGLAKVPGYGFGSSFKDKEHKNKQRERWKIMLNNKGFVKMAKKFKYKAEYLELFGETEAFKYFSKKCK